MCFYFPAVIVLFFNLPALAVIIINPDFEEGLTAWSSGKTAGTVASFTIDGDAYSGTKSAKVTVENAGGYCMIHNEYYLISPIEDVYTLDVYLKTSGNPDHIYLGVYNGNVFCPHCSVKNKIISDFASTYRHYRLKDISLSPGDYVQLELGITNGSTDTTSSIWFDSLRFYSQSRLENRQLALQNTINLLRFIAGENISIPAVVDINGDNKLGLQEVIFELQNVAEFSIPLYNLQGFWNGSLTGSYGNGLIQNWELKSSRKITGNLQYLPFQGGSTIISIDTDYVFEGNEFYFTATGSAIYNHPQLGTMTSDFEMIVTGLLGSDTEAAGYFNVNFSDPQWMDEYGTWSAIKN